MIIDPVAEVEFSTVSLSGQTIQVLYLANRNYSLAISDYTIRTLENGRCPLLDYALLVTGVLAGPGEAVSASSNFIMDQWQIEDALPANPRPLSRKRRTVIFGELARYATGTFNVFG